MKFLKWIFNNFLFALTLFLLAFIPLYPKIPLLDVGNTWVYVRIEDFVVAFAILFWIALVLFRKVSLRTPLTLPILLFWIIGGISTIHGVLLLFPTLPNVFSNVALLSFLRRVEYISLFFVAYSAMKEKKIIYPVILALELILVAIVAYGMGQKFLGFSAYLTMNEEFAKGIPIQLSQLSRVPSTFAGHYDLAAYLVLVIPIIVSLAFGFRKWFVKIALLATAALGFALLFMTVSRVSFFALLFSLGTLLLLQKKKLIIASVFILTLILLSFSPSLVNRFGNTVSEIDVLVDAKTGGAIGQVKEVHREYFANKIVLRRFTSPAEFKIASSSAILPYALIPPKALVLIEPNNPTGETLPQGTGYINLPLSAIIRREDQFYLEKRKENQGATTTETYVLYGDYLVKKAKAYDLSFTTRFQGEWPKTLDAFKRNIFLGSGYGSVSLAVDNNYLRILGESGLIGFLSFVSIFLAAGIYIRKLLPKVESGLIRSFVLGFVAGTFGLGLNAVFIDVFEASKIAFTYWLLMGVTIGLLHLHLVSEIDLFKEFKKTITSPYAILVFLLIASVALFSSLHEYFFVGDDFTWFRWIADCFPQDQCNSIFSRIINFFTDSQGFFYRPGTKVYFSLMYQAFWLNQTVYHLISLFLYFATSAILFLVSRKILRDNFLSVVSAVLFILLASHHENIFWISSTGFLFNGLFALLSLLFFIFWKEKGKSLYFVASLVFITLGLLFHEIGVIVPLLVILYDVVFWGKFDLNKIYKKSTYLILLVPLLPYLILRFFSQSHWFSGDYSYNLIKFPFNIIGNISGYLTLNLLGPQSLPFYQTLRSLFRDHTLLAVPLFLSLIFILILFCRKVFRVLASEEKKIVIFGSLFFIISLLPFLGLGNIASRYSYLSSVGFVIVFALFAKKAYGFLIGISDRYIALTSTILVTIVFVTLQLFQLQKIHTDWQVAGEKSKKFLISLQGIYRSNWKNDDMQFYFFNVPIKQGEAWIFPVGLSDALWFSFKNENLKVHIVSDLKFALDEADKSKDASVFQFDKNGNLEEVVRNKNQIEIIPVTDRK